MYHGRLFLILDSAAEGLFPHLMLRKAANLWQGKNEMEGGGEEGGIWGAHKQSPKGAVPYTQWSSGSAAVTVNIEHMENMNALYGWGVFCFVFCLVFLPPQSGNKNPRRRCRTAQKESGFVLSMSSIFTVTAVTSASRDGLVVLTKLQVYPIPALAMRNVEVATADFTGRVTFAVLGFVDERKFFDFEKKKNG